MSTDPRPPRTVWLIERGQTEGHTPTVWRTADGRWTEDANLAAQYPSQNVAEAVIEANSPIPSHQDRIGRAVEHSWLRTAADRRDPTTGGPRTEAGQSALNLDWITLTAAGRYFDAAASKQALATLIVKAEAEALAGVRRAVAKRHDWRPSPTSRDPERCAFGGCPDTQDQHVDRTAMLALLDSATRSPDTEAGAAGALPVPPERLVAKAQEVAAGHTNTNGSCRECGMLSPCHAAILAADIIRAYQP